MYLNNCGVRKTALFIGCSRTTVTNWVHDAKGELEKIIKDYEPIYSETADIIELDEIYTFIQKRAADSRLDCLLSELKACYCVCDWCWKNYGESNLQ